MSLNGGPWPITLTENEDWPQLGGPVQFVYYPNGYPGTAFNFTGYTASWYVRINANDASPVTMYTPTLSSTVSAYSDTWSMSLTHAQVNALVALLPNLTGYTDVLLSSGTGVNVHLFSISPLSIVRSATR